MTTSGQTKICVYLRVSTNDQVKALRAQGLSLTAIAKSLGISKGGVSKTLKKVTL